MKIAFRVDASWQIGTGHVMRCLTLAVALREHGARCHFICREHPGNLRPLVEQYGFETHLLPALPQPDSDSSAEMVDGLSHGPWLGCDWQRDARETDAVLIQLDPDWLVVDHYAIDRRWEEALSGFTGHVFIIDDLVDRHHTCDLLLDQNLGRQAHHYRGLVPEPCEVLAGPQFALLRPEFTALRDASLRRRTQPTLQRVLITMGGVDQPNATGKVLDALRHCALPADCEIVVVMGAQAPWLAQVQQTAETLPWSVKVLSGIGNMAEVMAESDLAIGAAGSTSWERCCVGLPTLLVVLADNQREGARALDANGAAMLLGEIEQIDQTLRPALAQIAEPGRLAVMSHRASEITDGHGVERVVEKMESRTRISG